MKKNNNKGFVLAETLVVTVFLMVIFSMLYSYFYPLIGEFEKREVYDDVDGKYSAYWIKRMIEDSSYKIPLNTGSTSEKNYFNNKGYIRFSCQYITEDSKRDMCIDLVKALQLEGCNDSGNNCNAFITRYTLRGKNNANANTYKFKETVKNSSSLLKSAEPIPCATDTSDARYNTLCTRQMNDVASEKVFRSGLKEYIINLPDYYNGSPNGAKYRVIASFQHKADNNNYYSYATIEVNK